MRNKKGTAVFLSSIASGVIVAVISAILIGEGRFAPPSSPSSNNYSVPPLETTDSPSPEPSPTPSVTPLPAPELTPAPTLTQQNDERQLFNYNDIQVPVGQTKKISDQLGQISIQYYRFEVPHNKTLTILLNDEKNLVKFNFSKLVNTGEEVQALENIASDLRYWQGIISEEGEYVIWVYSSTSMFMPPSIDFNMDISLN